MAPLSSTETFTTALAPADILARAQEWFVKYKGQVVATSENEIEVKSGSQAKMRLLGGAFIAGDEPARADAHHPHAERHGDRGHGDRRGCRRVRRQDRDEEPVPGLAGRDHRGAPGRARLSARSASPVR